MTSITAIMYVILRPEALRLPSSRGHPIVPVALIDSYRVFNSFWLGPVTTQVHYLKPIYFEEYGSLKTQEIAALVLDRINEKISEVLG